MIVDLRNSKCYDNAAETDRRLFFKVIHVIAVVQLCHVGTGTVKYDQTKTCQKNDNSEKTVIIVICFLFVFGFLTAFFSLLIMYSIADSFSNRKKKQGNGTQSVSLSVTSFLIICRCHYR